MSKLVLFAVACILTCHAFAQLKIAVITPSTNSTRICPTLDSAYNSALPGDHIYLPTGGFTIPPINKELHIFGAGYNPDSSSATGITVITGNVTVLGGGSNGSLQGVRLNYLYLGSIPGDPPVNNYTISYCELTNGLRLSSDIDRLTLRNSYIAATSNGGDFQFSFLSNNGSSLNNSFIINNFLSGIQVSGSNNLFSNNVFFMGFYFNSGYISLINNCVYQNNIFEYVVGNQNQNCVFNNNINATPNVNNGNVGSNNVIETLNLTFINPGTQNTNTGQYPYDVHNDYHLKNTSQGYGNGTDGKDVGVYGSAMPWKDGSIPSNPHIYFKNVAGQSNSSGILNATFKVKPQTY
jgi:hypothetical protein